MKYIIIAILLIQSLLFAQTNSGKIILNNVKQKLDRVDNYSADIQIKIDVDFLKVDQSQAEVYFKKPKKFKLQAQGFAMIPKASINYTPLNLLQNDFMSVYIKKDTLDLIECDVIKVIPVQDSSNIILATLWIDATQSVVSRVQATTKDKGTFTIHFKYGQKMDYGLPDSSVLFFDMSKSRLPQFPGSDGNAKKSMTGNVKIVYSNYKINQGIPDSIFEAEGTSQFGY